METRHAHGAHTHIQASTNTHKTNSFKVDCYIHLNILKLKMLGWGDGLVGKSQGLEFPSKNEHTK